MVVKKAISKVKRNNQKKNKLVKKGLIKSGKKPRRETSIYSQPLPKQPEEPDTEEESDHGEDMLSMVEKDDLDFIKSAVSGRSYSILNQIRLAEPSKNKAKKRKAEEDDNLEEAYENVNDNTKPMKSLLPIKTKSGLIQRAIEKEDSESEHEEPEENEKEEEGESDEEEHELVFQDTEVDTSKPVSTAQMLATREETLRVKKIHIGTLSSGLLETPEEKVTNFRTLLQILDDDTAEVYTSIRKLGIVSLLEVFKDLLPSYQLNVRDDSNVKLKKDTLKLNKYEETLVLYYKKYLQRLEKFAAVLFKKRGDNRKYSEADIKLAELAIYALCELLITHPYFNYAQNIAQVIIPFLNNRNKNVRETVTAACKTVFKEDKKEEITLKILRILNQFLKKREHNVNVDMLNILLYLKIKDVNLDKEREDDLKQKKFMSHKNNILSKKEKKRKKRLEVLNKEMLETKAEESSKTKQQNLTEITKILFGIYFRILKSSNNSKVLGSCLEGLAKYAHCINLEYYVDIVNLLDKLLRDVDSTGSNPLLSYREQLHCIQTVFSILSGYGEALHLDPTRFYLSLYQHLLSLSSSLNLPTLLVTLDTALIRRQKRLTLNRTVGFVKRLTTLSLQTLHGGSIAVLAVVKSLLQLCRGADVILDLESVDGRFRAELGDPEYCGAAGSALYEVALLAKHYHSVVGRYAKHVAAGVPASGEGSLPPLYGKCGPKKLFEDFDMTEMCFNPAIPIPKIVAPKSRPSHHRFADNKFKKNCFKRIKTTPTVFFMNI